MTGGSREAGRDAVGADDLRVRVPAAAADEDASSPKEVISTPASLQQKESFRDYDSLPQAVFPNGAKSGLGKRSRDLEAGTKTQGEEQKQQQQLHLQSPGSPQTRHYYPDEAFIISPVSPASTVPSDDHGSERRSNRRVATAGSRSWSPGDLTSASESSGKVGIGGDKAADEYKDKAGISTTLEVETSGDGHGERDEEEQANIKRWRRRYCGLRPIIFWAFVGISILLVVAIILGGVLGAARHTQSQGADVDFGPHGDGGGDANGGGGGGGGNNGSRPANATLVRGGLHASTRLSAVAWQDRQGNQHRAVASQDLAGFLTVSYWDGLVWSPFNVSSQLALKGANATRFLPKRGTPLAMGLTNASGLSVWYLTPSNVVVGASARVVERKEWEFIEWTRNAAWQLVAYDDSDLAAATRRVCTPSAAGDGKNTTCSDDWFVFYKPAAAGGDNYLNYINETRWRETSGYTVDATPALPTGQYDGLGEFALALTPYVTPTSPDDGAGQDMRLFLGDSDGRVHEVMSTTPTTLAYGSQLGFNGAEGVAGHTGQLAASSFESGTQMLLFSQAAPDPFSNTTYLEARHWARNATAWSTQSRLKFHSSIDSTASFSMTNSSVVAATQDQHLYVLVNGTIQEYSWTQDSPLDMYAVGIVSVFEIVS